MEFCERVGWIRVSWLRRRLIQPVAGLSKVTIAIQICVKNSAIKHKPHPGFGFRAECYDAVFRLALVNRLSDKFR